MIVNAEVQGMLSSARRFASLADSFSPQEAVRFVVGQGHSGDSASIAGMLSMLRAECSVVKGAKKSAETWSMLPAVRRRQLLTERYDDHEWEAIRAEADDRQMVDYLKQALSGTGPFSPAALKRVAVDSPRQVSRATTLSVILERAGTASPAYALLPELKAKLNQHQVAASGVAALSGGFYGRKDETEKLLRWVGRKARKPPVKVAFVSGLPGIGKSYLLEWIINTVMQAGEHLVVRLDFDRRGLVADERDALLDEVSRQIGDQIPKAASDLRNMRLEQARRRGTSLEQLSGAKQDYESIGQLAHAIKGSKRPVLVILDTMEALRARGDTHPEELFRFLDTLVQGGIKPMSVIAAGRPDSLDPTALQRVGCNIVLEGLDAFSSRKFLKALDVPARFVRQILELAGGNPLLMRLSAKAWQTGTLKDEALVAQLRKSPKRGLAGPSAETRQATIAAYLYRSILSRIDDPDLQKLAHPGLVLREISAEAIRTFLGPMLGVDVSGQRADEMFEELASHHWLVQRQGNEAVHRSDLRLCILPMIYADRPDQAEKVDRAAAEWFEKKVPSNPVMALYHRLQLTRFRDTVPPISSELADQFSADMLAELPVPASDAVRAARGERSSAGRERTVAPRSRAIAARDLMLVLERGDAVEAHRIYRRSFARSSPTSGPAREAVFCYAWLVGRWTLAQDLLPSVAAVGAESPMMIQDASLALRAELRFGDLVSELRSRSHSALDRVASMRGAKAGMRLPGAALDMAVGASLGRDWLARNKMEVAQAVFDAWSLASRSAGRRAQSLAHERLRIFGRTMLNPGASNDPRAEIVCALDRLNPYAAVLSRYAKLELSPRLGEYLHALIDQLAGEMPTLHVADRVVKAPPELSGIVDLLGAVGLSSHWAGCYAYFHGDDDLKLIANSAARWRRTAGGLWSFEGKAPAEWIQASKGEDHLASLEFNFLFKQSDPALAALRQLRIWARPDCDPDARNWPNSRATGRTVRRALDSAILQARRMTDAAGRSWREAAQRSLPSLAEHFPDGMAVPLAVLASQPSTKESVRANAPIPIVRTKRGGPNVKQLHRRARR